MFKCENKSCQKTTELGQPESRVVVEQRQKFYERKIRRGYNRGYVETIEGWEIVKELILCPICYKKRTGKTAEIKRSEKLKVKPKLPRHKNYKKPYRPKKRFDSAPTKPPKVKVVNPLKPAKE